MIPAVRSDLVLVPGAWLGGWCWDRVVTELAALDLQGRAVALPGLDDDLPADFESHLAAIVDALAESHRSVLVGHSHGGSLISATAARHSGTALALIFLDAALPRAGESTADTWHVDVRATLESRVDGNGFLPPSPGDIDGLDVEDASRLRAHPWSILTTPVETTSVELQPPIGYIRSSPQDSTYECARLAVASTGHPTAVMAGGHYPMFTNPTGTARALAHMLEALGRGPMA